MKLSQFGEKFTANAGILSLMDDMGSALTRGGEDLIMMGGGNPSHIPEVEAALRQRLRQIVDDDLSFRRLIGIYDPPQGEKEFCGAIADLLHRAFGWPIDARNVGLTNGSQSAFFMIFNMLAGPGSDGVFRHIHFPMAPEYIGYADAGIYPNLMRATPPRIELIGDDLFKYRVNFDRLQLDDTTGALCVSRPTNPTGNVLTDNEMARLDALAREKGIPLIIDSAYGTPFPNLMFTDATPLWNDNIIILMSLSKLGMPSARTGIVIASEEVIRALASVNAIVNLSTGSFGAFMAQEMVRSGDILRISDEIVRPYYQQRSQVALEELRHNLQGVPYRIHVPEGAMFLWLWLKGLPITSAELYQRLKARGVLVVSGHYFFPGLNGDWPHRHQCLRITYTQEEDKVRRGLAIIADEVHRAYAEAGR